MFLKKILSYVYPITCVICGKTVKSNSYTCTNCASILKYYRERRLLKSNLRVCEEIFSLYEYNGIIKKKIWQFKFRNQKYLSKFFAYSLSKRILELDFKFDIIIPVPVNLARYMERGYNQSYLLAKEMSKNMQKEVFGDVLIKLKNNKRQSELNERERQSNVLGVYNVKNEYKIKGKIVLLVDDIYTTGSTINECAKMLKRAGAKKVIAVTIAYA